MLTISKPLSAAQVRTYHAEEFSNARDNYYTQGDEIRGQWHGRLARAVGTLGRRAGGAHSSGSPTASIRSPASRSSSTRRPGRTPTQHGETVTTMEHRAGWDATFSAPEERLADRARRRRCPRARGASRERARWPSTKRSGTSRRGSAAIIRPRRPGSGSPPASSTTARGPSTGTPRRNSTRTSCSST